MTLHIHFEAPPMMSIQLQDLDYNTRMLYNRWEDTEADDDWEAFELSLFDNFQVENHLLGNTTVTEIYEVE